MSVDAELDEWRREWQSDGAVPPDLRKRVERQVRILKIGLIADIAVTVGIGGATAVLAIRSPHPDMIVLAAATWLFIAVAWAFRLTSTRGRWSPAAVDSAAFTEFLVADCRRKLAGLRFGTWLFACEMIFCLTWIYYHSSRQQPVWQWLRFSAGWMDGVWALTVVFYVFVVWYRRKKRAELERLLALQGEMAVHN